MQDLSILSFAPKLWNIKYEWVSVVDNIRTGFLLNRRNTINHIQKLMQYTTFPKIFMYKRERERERAYITTLYVLYS